MSETAITYGQANTACGHTGGFLASIDAQEVTDILVSEITTLPFGERAHFGIEKDYTRNAWYWLDGAKADYFNWDGAYINFRKYS